MIRAALAVAVMASSGAASANEPEGLHRALQQLTNRDQFSGAVVVRRADGVRFARGYGMADPFSNRPFTVRTPTDSGSLAKPVTATIILMLAKQGRIDLDQPAQDFLPELPGREITVRHLLAHSAGIELPQSPEALAGKTNVDLVRSLRGSGAKALFAPGTAFNYCNLCTVALALMAERVAGKHYLTLARELAGLPPGVTIRPQRLAAWTGRAIGYRRVAGRLERFDSWEGEAFYGAANLSISAAQLAEWGAQWWQAPVAAIRPLATTAAMISGKESGLSWGNWYCASTRRQCHYIGHHEGFHHLLYWDANRRLSVAMVTNNTLDAGLQQRLQRALVAFAENRPADARRELARPLAGRDPEPGQFRFADGELVEVMARGGQALVRRDGLDYPAYPIGPGVRYLPGVDAYVSQAADGALRWLSLYEDARAARSAKQATGRR